MWCNSKLMDTTAFTSHLPTHSSTHTHTHTHRWNGEHLAWWNWHYIRPSPPSFSPTSTHPPYHHQYLLCASSPVWQGLQPSGQPCPPSLSLLLLHKVFPCPTPTQPEYEGNGSSSREGIHLKTPLHHIYSLETSYSLVHDSNINLLMWILRQQLLWARFRKWSKWWSSEHLLLDQRLSLIGAE